MKTQMWKLTADGKVKRLPMVSHPKPSNHLKPLLGNLQLGKEVVDDLKDKEEEEYGEGEDMEDEMMDMEDEEMDDDDDDDDDDDEDEEAEEA